MGSESMSSNWIKDSDPMMLDPMMLESMSSKWIKDSDPMMLGAQ